MNHIAIMKPSWKLIDKILSGEKTIESRWYQTRRAPWNAISVDDTVYFKDSGKPVTAAAKVQRVLQFEIKNEREAQAIVDGYGKEICLLHNDVSAWSSIPKYCILIFLKNARSVPRPFHINKAGFGSACAWLCIESINNIKTPATK